MLDLYLSNQTEREKQGLPSQPLNAEQTASLVELLKVDSVQDSDLLFDLLEIS